MWHCKFLGTLLSVLALLGFMESRTALAADSTASEFSMSQPQDTRGFDGSFQLAVMGGSAIPLDMPPEKAPAKVQPEKPKVEKPKAIPKATKKASKPKKKKVKKANVKKAPAKKPVEEEEGFFAKTLKSLVGGNDDKKDAASESPLQKTAGKKTEPVKEEEGLFTKTLKTLVGDGDDKKDATSKSPSAKTVKKIPAPEKEEEGLLTKTLKSLVGGDDKKKEQTTEKNTLNPITMAPTGSTTQKKEEKQPKTAKSETKKTLKDSFEKLIGVGAVKGDGNSKTAKTGKPAGQTKSAKKEESGGLLEGILGGSNKKDSPQQAKAEGAVKESPAPARPARITARKYIEQEEAQNEEAQLEKNRGGVKKGKNVLKESFKTLITDDKKKEE
jgi:hypothetical protein